MAMAIFHAPLIFVVTVRPGPVTDMTISSPNPTQLKIGFRIPRELETFMHLEFGLPGIKHRIMYKNDDDDAADWIQTPASNNLTAQFREITLNDLVPYRRYSVKVEIISGKVLARMNMEHSCPSS